MQLNKGNIPIVKCEELNKLLEAQRSFKSPAMSTTALPELPEGTWIHILHLIPISYRLRSCSLTNTKWARWAAAATVAAELPDRQNSQQKWPLLRNWIHEYVQHFESLQLVGLWYSGTALTTLPCQHLRSLDLSDCMVLLGSTAAVDFESFAGGQHSGILNSCTKLTSLSLRRCIQPSSTNQAGQQQAGAVGTSSGPYANYEWLTALTGLHRLAIEHDRGTMVLPEDLLLHLKSLTELELSTSWYARQNPSISNAHLQHMTPLSHLNSLSITGRGQARAAFSDDYLDSGDQKCDGNLLFTTQETPWFSGLTGLSTLALKCITLHPSVLEGLMQLQSLCLAQVSLAGPAPGAPNSNSAQLLNLLQGFTQLTTLQQLQHQAKGHMARSVFCIRKPHGKHSVAGPGGQLWGLQVARC